VIIEAQSARDGIVEAIRWDGPSYVFGMQWHPEFRPNVSIQNSDCQKDGSPIVNGFLDHARHARS
jgi:putative glutamine amidotransferase